jgi:hypothetical protein
VNAIEIKKQFYNNHPMELKITKRTLAHFVTIARQIFLIADKRVGG